MGRKRGAKPRLKGRALLVRYADDFVVVFSREDDARRVMDVLPKRFGSYGLTLHPDKTRLLRFDRPRRGPGGDDDESRPGTFDLLGHAQLMALSATSEMRPRVTLSRSHRRV